MQYKNRWLFLWAVKHLTLEPKNGDIICKKSLKNDILLKLMDLSGVTPRDAWFMLNEIEGELKTRGCL